MICSTYLTLVSHQAKIASGWRKVLLPKGRYLLEVVGHLWDRLGYDWAECLSPSNRPVLTLPDLALGLFRAQFLYIQGRHLGCRASAGIVLLQGGMLEIALVTCHPQSERCSRDLPNPASVRDLTPQSYHFPGASSGLGLRNVWTELLGPRSCETYLKCGKVGQANEAEAAKCTRLAQSNLTTQSMSSWPCS